MKLRVLHCGYINVSPRAAYGTASRLVDSAAELFAPDSKRIRLPVSCYLIEHPRGLILVDAGLPRAISPNGARDSAEAKRLFPAHLDALFRPEVPAGKAINEQLESIGLRPEDIDLLLLTHLDADHVAALSDLRGVKRVLVSEDEYFWACRAVYKARQPWKLWMETKMEHFWFRGSPIGPVKWSYDVFGDESLIAVNVPGHTDGMAAVIVKSGKSFVLLAADAAFSHRNIDDLVIPGCGFDNERQLLSLKWLKEMAADPGCIAVLSSHDPDIPEKTIEF